MGLETIPFSQKRKDDIKYSDVAQGGSSFLPGDLGPFAQSPPNPAQVGTLLGPHKSCLRKSSTSQNLLLEQGKGVWGAPLGLE